MTCFHVASALANVPSGSVVDLTGRRVLIQSIALVGGAAGLFAVGLAGSFVALALAVTLIGATNMLWHPAAIAYLSGHLPKNRGYALSIHALGANVGDAVAPLVAGWLMLSLTWHATAEINAVLGVVVAAVIYLLTRNLLASRGGRALVALRDNPIGAETSGINLARYKVLAFGVSAAYAGIAGSLIMFTVSNATGTGYSLNLSIDLLTGVVIGGLASMPGSLLGGLLVVFLPDFAKDWGDGTLSGAIDQIHAASVA